MADYIVESRMWLPKPRADVFAFFADPANLVRVAPPSLGLRLLGPPPAMRAGTTFDMGLRWVGIPLRWRVFVREYDPPYRFLDVQVRGPYARWEHRHIFLSEAEGTTVEDRIVYRLPLGALGKLAHVLFVQRQLQAMWRYRRRKISELLAPVSDAPR
jgi:ligand-binding SRPBCC domain-containing protein